MRKWLDESGFTLERQLTVSHFRLALLKRLLPLRLLVRLDALASLTGGLWQLSPSVFTLSRAAGDTPHAEQGAFFCCPECRHSPLDQTTQGLACPACGKEDPVQDGIYDFR